MFEATNHYLNTHSEVWSPIPIIGNYKNHLSMIIFNIRKLIHAKPSRDSRSNGALRTLKLQLADKMDLLDDVMEAYASDIGDERLRRQSANSHSDYIQLPSDNFENKVRQVIALLEKHVSEMTDYGINSEQIEDAKLCFNDYLRILGKPSTYKTESEIGVSDMDGLFKEAGIYIYRLDNVMQRFRRSNVQFFVGYQESRQIIHY